MATDFESKLAASLSEAAAQGAVKEQAANDAAAEASRLAREEADRFIHVNALATRFNNNKLEPLFAKLQTSIRRAGFIMDGSYVKQESEQRGITGRTLAVGEVVLSGTLSYRLDSLTVRVSATGPQCGACYSEVKEFSPEAFDEGDALAWFESHLSEAAAKLVSTGEVPKSRVVTYNGNVVE